LLGGNESKGQRQAPEKTQGQGQGRQEGWGREQKGDGIHLLKWHECLKRGLMEADVAPLHVSLVDVIINLEKPEQPCDLPGVP
jgi:hypothetical protein